MPGSEASSDEMVVSVHPNYASEILAGRKTVELRRRVPALTEGVRLWIYSTRPVASIVGFVFVKEVIRKSPHSLWRKIGRSSGVSKKLYMEYFSGASVAIGIVLEKAQHSRAIPLEQLRRIRVGFHPPQVMAKLSKAEVAAMELYIASGKSRMYD